ncbi:serine/threonine-protein kinase PINK1, mitochondrial-like [Mizuhopecten yessoensis]|uniref:non-specific serine/threonine protein kinase n=1 Tax=Mizuhopecten yessoensis TaxID=6573 RepID=A0A210R2U9_MIZYE|nr:serine/threonine-protein kinase PINK1, mitochondrial-like [Mizuhopecten yessoensis]OWF55383.1 Serine/threonine-protein kinase PINK1, mitochondrial [Mizuhopecten yessoensis]
MSARLIISKVWRHGKQVVQSAIRNKIEKQPVAVRAKPAYTVKATPIQPKQPLLIGRLFPLVSTRTLASELRRRAAIRFALPNRPTLLPTFALAFAGVALQQQEVDKDDLSSEVRDIFGERQEKRSILDNVQQLSLGAFDLGNLIGQGCNAAVYDAKLKSPQCEEFVQPAHFEDDDNNSIISNETDIDIVVIGDDGELSDLVEMDDDIVILPQRHDLDDDVFIHDYGNDDSDIVIIGDLLDEDTEEGVYDQGQDNDSTFNNGSERQGETTEPDPGHNLIGQQNSDDYYLAIKMMYNYDIESNTDAIMRAMLKEAVPARTLTVDQDDHQLWQNGNRVRLKSLPGHPNIVEMLGVFVDPLPDLPGALDNYPAALPQRLNPQGLGRNQTMFLVMKKYDMTLREFLAQEELSPRIRCLLLCQLLEGTVHLRQHSIAHRDLKSDNILLDCHNEATAPHLVISDFGCCLADEENGLQLPYPTDEINKGGNGALMPPEISCTTPGRKVRLDFSKSDLWAVGSLAYEVFGQDNPFYGGARITRKLDGRTYQDTDIPSMSGDVPDVVRFLVPRMLRRNPNQRPEPEMAANLLQIYLHFPDWLEPGNRPSKKHITESLMILVTQILIGWKLRGERSFTVEKQLQLTFLRRLVISDLDQAMAYYHGK